MIVRDGACVPTQPGMSGRIIFLSDSFLPDNVKKEPDVFSE